MRRLGFTLIEILIATLIGALVAVVALASVRTVVSARDKVDSINDYQSEVDYICNLLQNDLRNLYRDTENGSMLECEMIDDGLRLAPDLSFYTVSRNKLRKDSPESDVYEVQYFTKYDEQTDRRTLVYRRAPAIVGLEEDRDISSGGVMIVISKNILNFSVNVYSEGQWLDQWLRDENKLPELVEINVSCGDAENNNVVSRNVTFNFTRISGSDPILGDEENTEIDSLFKEISNSELEK